MSIKKYLLLMAGGAGTRMGADRPKQFLEIGGKTILQLTMDKFTEAVPEIKIVTVLPADSIEMWKSYCLRNNLVHPQRLVAGGITRFHSVRNGLEKIPDDALVAVHDGVRPLISTGLIRSLFSLAEGCDGVIPVVPCTDTLKVLEKSDGRLLSTGETVDRSRLFGAQTPQIFQAGLLKKAYSQAYRPEFTDDASVAEAHGMKLKYPEGERYNIKLTCPDDLRLAALLLGSHA